MYMGHFAIALGARRWLRSLPLAWLLFASIEPDLHDALGSWLPALGIGEATHSFPGILYAAAAVALLTALLFRRIGLALGASLLVLSHVIVDYLTSWLPLWHGGPHAGLHLYAIPWADFMLETTTIGVGLALYARSPDLRRPARAGLVAMGMVMVGLQAVWNFSMASG
ncbi:hypothetical protein GCM10008098_02480 [Rhodanobacter panaciterrae]|uniref:LexA-binding, inner membrane-associated hydrolase n=1 Tax=Rhodanobacter panaciterrae TaxID=490572 RepID=A0ABQ2ZFD0_9GAMM|nr:hypothetical protein [Rhodanobacter panaciterrae]GGY15081.1 hypothetical protein GCM10008098_02480 [Rhodanobacter panaciterrae]